MPIYQQIISGLPIHVGFTYIHQYTYLDIYSLSYAHFCYNIAMLLNYALVWTSKLPIFLPGEIITPGPELGSMLLHRSVMIYLKLIRHKTSIT